MNDTEAILTKLANHDQRIFFAFNMTTNAFIYQNPAFFNFFQIPAGEVIPNDLYELVHLDDKRFVKSTFKHLEPGKFIDDVEFRVLLNDNKEYTLRISMLLYDREDQQRILTGYGENITENKAHFEKIQALTSKKDSILNILSHDLAGPLTAIQNYAYLLFKRTNAMDDPEVSKLVTSIERISKRSIILIQEFIKQEFVESVGVDVVKKRINLTDCVKNFMEEYFLTSDETGKRFNFEYNKENIFAEVDENKLMQVIQNLISNSIKFTPDGGAITVNLQQQEEIILITVKDTGVGIPEKFHEKLFEKFSNARRTGLKGEPSVGLGMSIIKTIVEWHQGKIWFESEQNKGTTFFIEIPGTI